MNAKQFRERQVSEAADFLRPLLRPGYDARGVAESLIHKIARRTVRDRSTVAQEAVRQMTEAA